MVRRGVGDDEGRRNIRRGEVELGRDQRPEAPLPVERAKHLRNVDDLCLDLDEKKSSRSLVPSDDVDQAALAGMSKRDLRTSDPADAAQVGDDRLNERRVAGVRHSLDVACSSPDRKVEPRLEHPRHAPDRCHGDRIEVASFDPGDRLIRNASQPRDICLPHPAPNPKDPQQGADSLVVHGVKTMQRSAYPAISRRGLDI